MKELNNYILCLKHGSKYSAEYVNILHNMVKRNITIPYTFICLTEDPLGLDKNIVVLDLPEGLSGWWYKPYIYSKELPLPENSMILYLDLDIVINSNLDKLFQYETDNWCAIHDYNRFFRNLTKSKYNSSVVRFKHGELDQVWTQFIKNPEQVMKTHYGDQDWLWTVTKDTGKFWPHEWVRSWKWELKAAGISIPDKDCCICVFHGDPKPHNCKDTWVEKTWK